MARGSAAIVLGALRELREGAEPSFELLARASGRRQAYLEGVAKRGGWHGPASAPAPDPEMLEKRLMTFSDRLVSDLETASDEGHATGSYNKQRIDALASMLKMVEKIGEMARLPERAAEKQQKDDEELAAALALIDARIVELACELAAAMGGETVDGRDCLEVVA